MGDPQQDPKNPNPESAKIEVAQTELDELRSKAERLDKMTETAKQADKDTPEELLDELGDMAADYAELMRKPPAGSGDPNNPPPNKSSEPAKAPVAGNQPDPQLAEALRQTNQTALQAYLSSSYIEYVHEQAALPEEERDSFKKPELMKAITGEDSQLIVAMARREGGNLFAAAAKVLDLAGGKKRAADNAKKAEVAKNAAAGSANLPAGGAAKDLSNLTPQQRYDKYQEDRRSQIAPPSKFEMPT